MKKIDVDYEYLTADLLKRIAQVNPEGFKEHDVIVLSEVDSELEDRIKVVLDNKVFLIKKSLVETLPDTFDDEYFKSLKENQEEACDDEFC
ncbi:hypothetical protein [Flagellimonas nanhaiensis]|uniref:Uncharacterized protein n=1 Tax=Flagellimonas nanhaiensis TaxID=2292706 RepID=A0A371JMZ0_9FLAO|nr:hypothetical protein [Allomuricauda nanhaiensis]RDY58602.1 hypothetical protein DX873_12975 [Allomuricauda nanhaiensis]